MPSPLPGRRISCCSAWPAGAPACGCMGAQDLDRYGRTLAHLVDGDGRLLSEALIASGLGFALAIPPNTRLAGCLFTVERQARLQRRGLWQRSPVVRLDAKPPLRSGFGVWRGRVSGVGGSARGAWLELEERIFVRLGPGDLPARARQLEGRVVELRGWLIDRRQGGRKLDSGRLRWLLDIQDPRHLSPVD
ncbi:thermonuclease family protein [Marinobacterium aestuariivivens]|uniref:Thermonuclease family protein n=1 Tax=Marinobacterium aestuariivivens TaxID=1698799 RepID=A0ABW1ZYM0_9GAMM